MDPFSITTATIGLVSTISGLLVQTDSFAGEVSEAREDMRAVEQELDSLAVAVTMLQGDRQLSALPQPDPRVVSLVGTLFF
jgi:hypothetical protein